MPVEVPRAARCCGRQWSRSWSIPPHGEVADTLPGVAIAIPLVPPLVVAGLLLESERYRAAAGALVLFGTNVTAIIATGTVVLLASQGG
jgi:uncharacterized membrane protein